MADPGTMAFYLVLGGAFILVLFAAMAWGRRRMNQPDEEEDDLSGIKEQVLWRALAQGGQITAEEAASQAGLPAMMVERALMSLVADGKAAAEPGDEGTIVYRIDAPLGPSDAGGADTADPTT